MSQYAKLTKQKTIRGKKYELYRIYSRKEKAYKEAEDIRERASWAYWDREYKNYDSGRYRACVVKGINPKNGKLMYGVYQHRYRIRYKIEDV